MAMLTPEDVARLNALQGYDRMLAVDALARQRGVSAEDVERALQAQPSTATMPEPAPPPEASPSVAPVGEADRMALDGFRYAYDPSREAKERRAQVAHAIRCPTCSAALGIPDVRPIQVTCPACGAVSTFAK